MQDNLNFKEKKYPVVDQLRRYKKQLWFYPKAFHYSRSAQINCLPFGPAKEWAAFQEGNTWGSFKKSPLEGIF